MGSAELQLAARVEGITQADVREALWERRELVKSWTTEARCTCIRPTSSLWTAARRPSSTRPTTSPTRRGRRRRGCGDRSRARGQAAHQGGARRRRLERVGPAPREKLASGWGYYLGDAASAGVLCFGPPSGSKVTFVHPGDWLGPQREWEPSRGAARGGAPLRRDVRPRVSPPVSRVVHRPQLHSAAARDSSRARPAGIRGRACGRREAATGVRPIRDGLPRARHLVPPGSGSRSPRMARAATKALRAPVSPRRRHLRRDLEPEEAREEDRADGRAGEEAHRATSGPVSKRRRSGSAPSSGSSPALSIA